MKRGTMINVELTFTEPVLGTCPKDPKTYADYVASKIAKRKDLTDEERAALNADEVTDAYNDIEAVEERGWTGFMEDDGKPYVFNYWVRGFLKSAIQSLMETGDLKKIGSYKTKIDRYVHIHPRKLFFALPEGGKAGVIERPLRAMTAQGPRVTLARSDTMPVGTKLIFQIEVLKNGGKKDGDNGVTVDVIREAFEFGRYEGMSQWRSGGYGQFEVTAFEVGE